MTATEAAGLPHVVKAIAERAGADRRTVLKCLRGESPRGTVWGKVWQEAQLEGVSGIPDPPARQPRAAKPCPECARKDAEIATLKRALEASAPRKLAVVPLAPAPEPGHATG